MSTYLGDTNRDGNEQSKQNNAVVQDSLSNQLQMFCRLTHPVIFVVPCLKGVSFSVHPSSKLQKLNVVLPGCEHVHQMKHTCGIVHAKEPEVKFPQ